MNTYSQVRKFKDVLARQWMFGLALAGCSLIFIIGAGLYWKSRSLLSTRPFFELLFSTHWRPSEGAFGFAPFISGTIWVTLIAILLAGPLSLLVAIYLSEYAPTRVKEGVKPALDVLSGVSPVIFGVFGVLAIVPLVGQYIKPFVERTAGFIPFLRSENFTGFGVLSAGIILAMMIFPIITSVAQEVISSVPREAREVSLGLGATKWETIKRVVLKKASPGLIAAIILGLSRAFGETIAVLMVVGNVVQMPSSLFDSAYTLPALIANNYGEMMSVPLYDSALMFSALILLVVTVFFNIAAWLILLRIEREYV